MKPHNTTHGRYKPNNGPDRIKGGYSKRFQDIWTRCKRNQRRYHLPQAKVSEGQHYRRTGINHEPILQYNNIYGHNYGQQDDICRVHKHKHKINHCKKHSVAS